MTDYKMAMKILLKNDFNAVDFSYARLPAIEAVEKQKAKKPIKAQEHIRYAMCYVCPNCGKTFSGTGIANYCYHCGQKLDWSKEDE